MAPCAAGLFSGFGCGFFATAFAFLAMFHFYHVSVLFSSCSLTIAARTGCD